jgi:undecaprenyl-diphosphatase
MWLGLEAREAAAFSFLMAIPAIAGAAVLQIPDLAGAGPEGLSTSVLLVGGLAAGLTGVLAIRTFVAMLARRSFHFFAPYCWAVGVLYLAFVTLR